MKKIIFFSILLTISGMSISHASGLGDLLKKAGDGITSGVQKVGDKISGRGDFTNQNTKVLEEFEDFILVESEFIADEKYYVNSKNSSQKRILDPFLRDANLPLKRLSKKIEINRANWNNYVAQPDAMKNLYSLKAEYLTFKQTYTDKKNYVLTNAIQKNRRTTSYAPKKEAVLKNTTAATNTSKSDSPVHMKASNTSSKSSKLIKQGCQMGKDDVKNGLESTPETISLKQAGSKYRGLELQIRNEYIRCYNLASNRNITSEKVSQAKNTEASIETSSVTIDEYTKAKRRLASNNSRINELNKILNIIESKKERMETMKIQLAKNSTPEVYGPMIDSFKQDLNTTKAKLKDEIEERNILLSKNVNEEIIISTYESEQKERDRREAINNNHKEIRKLASALASKGTIVDIENLPKTLAESISLQKSLTNKLIAIENQEKEKERETFIANHKEIKEHASSLESIPVAVNIMSQSDAHKDSEKLESNAEVTNGMESQTDKDAIKTSSYRNEVPGSLISNNLIKTLAIIVVVGFLIILIAGSTKKVVIYYDIKDFIISFMPWGSLIAGFILLDIYQPNGEVDYENLTNIQMLIFSISMMASAIFMIWSLKLSISNNRNVVLGLIIGVFKIVTSLLGIVILLGQLGKIFSPETARKETIIAVLLFAFFIWLGNKLINGEDVYQTRGWSHQ